MSRASKLLQITFAVGVSCGWVSAAFAQSLQNSYYILNPSFESQAIEVMSLSDGNTIQAESATIALSRNEVGTIDAGAGLMLGSEIRGTGAFTLGSGLNRTDLPVPAWFQGTQFVVPHIRKSHSYNLLSIHSDANVTIQRNGVDEQIVLAKGVVTQFDAGSNNTISGIITSDVPILVTHVGTNNGSTWGDVFPVPPAVDEVWGVRSKNVMVGAAQDNTSLTVYASGGASQSYTLSAGGRLVLNVGSNTSQGRGDAFRIVADKPITAVQYADSDGSDATTFWPHSYHGTYYGIPVSTQYVAVACPEPNTQVTLYDGAAAPVTQNCSGSLDSYPGKAYFGASSSGANIGAGAYIESTKPIYIYYEASSPNDEHQLAGHKNSYYVLDPWLQESSLSVMSLADSNVITAGSTTLSLDEYEIGSIPAGSDLSPSQEIIGTKPFDVGNTVDGSDLPVPSGFMGLRFAVPHIKGHHIYDLLSPQGDAELSITINGTVDTLTLQEGQTVAYDAGNNNTVSGLISSSRPILVYHRAQSNAGSGMRYDAYPVTPLANELWGIRSNNIYLSGFEDGTSVSLYADNGQTQNLTINAGQTVAVNIGDQLGQGEGGAIHVVADKPISGMRYDDGDGSEITGLWPIDYRGNKYGIPVDTQYIAAVCIDANTKIILVNADNSKVVQTCSASGDIPDKSFFGSTTNGTNIAAGAYVESDKPIFLYYESSGTEDEKNLLGTVVQPSLPPTAQVSVDLNQGEAPLTVQFDGTNSSDNGGSPILDYEWDFGNSTSGNGVSVSNTYIQSGNYTATLTVTNEDGDTDQASQLINVEVPNAPPTAAFMITPASGPAPLDVSFDASTSIDTDGSIVSYSWDFGDGNFGSGVSTNHTYQSDGLYSPTLTVTDDDGAIDTYFLLVDVEVASTAPVINTIGGSTNANPFNVDGTAPPESEIRLYVNGVFQQSVQSDIAGAWQVGAYLFDGQNLIKATVWDGVAESGFSNEITVTYTNTLSRDLSGLVIDDVMVLTPGNPAMSYTVNTNHLTVSTTGKLIMQPGTVIKFGGTSQRLKINGSLLVNGTELNPVVLTSGRGSPSKDDWYGIEVTSSATSVSINYAVIEYAQRGVYFNNVTGTVSHSVLRHNNHGVYLQNVGSSMLIEDSTIENNTTGIFMSGDTNPSLTGNTISSNSNYGIQIYGPNSSTTIPYPHPVITGNNIVGNGGASDNVYLYGFSGSSRTEVLNAQGNWWGTNDADTIGLNIRDHTDTVYAPYVDYSGYLGGPVPGGVPFNSGVTELLTIETDTILVAGESYAVLGDLHVPVGVTLTVEAGAMLPMGDGSNSTYDLIVDGSLVLEAGSRLEFGGTNQRLKINGSLLVNGTELNPVVLTSGRGSPSKDDWYGIEVTSSATSVSINYAVIEYAQRGVYFNNVTGTVSHSVLRHNNHGVYLQNVGSSMLIEDSTIENNTTGIFMSGDTNPSLTGNTISSNSNYGIQIYGPNSSTTIPYPHPVITGNNIVGNGGASDNVYLYGFSGSSRTEVLNAQGNWWGTNDADTIGLNIRDHTDTVYAPYVDYSGYLGGPVPGGVPFNSGVTELLTIETDTILVAGESYAVLGDLHVPVGVTLTVEAGAMLPMGDGSNSTYDLIVDGSLVLEAGSRLEFGGTNQRLKINGSLLVNGTELNPVVLTSGRGSPSKDDWYGIEVTSSATSVSINYAVIEYAQRGVYFNNVTGTVSHSVLRHNNHGVYLQNVGSSMLIEDSTIENNTTGIFMSGDTNPSLTGNTISSNSNYGIQIYGPNSSTTIPYPHPVITGNNIVGNGGASDNVYLYGFSGSSRTEVLNAQGNWWGTNDADTIGLNIRDHTDTVYAPYVDYSGYLGGPVPGGVPFNSGVTELLTIETDTILVAGESYAVLGDLHVPVGVTLTVEAGAMLPMGDGSNSTYDLIVDGSLVLEAGSRLEFGGTNQRLKINGSLLVNGTELNPVVLTSGRGSPSKDDWYGIEVTSSATSVSINYAVIEYAQRGVYFNNVTGTVSHSVLRHNNHGVYLQNVGSSMLIEDSTIENNTTGIFMSGDTNPSLTGNTISSNSNYGIQIYGPNSSTTIPYPHPVITGNNIVGNGGASDNVYLYGFSGSSRTEVLNAQGNWWGTNDADTIGLNIRDHTDTVYAPYVDYSGYLGGPVPGGVPFNSGVTELLTIETDTILVAGESYAVLGDLHVPVGVTLTVEAGAMLPMGDGSNSTYDLIVDGSLVLEAGSRLEFGGTNQRLKINGSLLVNGTELNPVVLTSGRGSPSKDDWYGIEVTSSATSVSINYAVIEYAQRGVYFNNVTGTVSHSLIRENTYGVYVYGNSDPQITANIIINNTYGIYLHGTGNDLTNPDPLIHGNDIYNNSIADLYVQNYGAASTILIDLDGNYWGGGAPSIGGNSSALAVPNPSSDSVFGYPYIVGSTVSDRWFSPNGDSIKDSTAINIDLNRIGDWDLQVESNGQVVRTASGTGQTISFVWDGLDNSGASVIDSTYEIFVYGYDAQNVRHRSHNFNFVFLDTIAPVADIDDGLNGQTISNISELSVPGSALDLNFENYNLEYGSGASPINWSSIETATMPIANNQLGIWGLYLNPHGSAESIVPNGAYTLRLNVADLAGNTSQDTVQLTVDNLVLESVSATPQNINPQNGESTTLAFIINQAATVKMEVYSAHWVNDEWQQTLLKEHEETYATSGSHSMVWDGRDDSGAIVDEDVVFFRLTATAGGLSYVYDPDDSVSTGIPASYAGASINYDPYNNKPWRKTVNLANPSYLRLSIRLSTVPYANTIIYPNGEEFVAFDSGQQTLTWNGALPSGEIYVGTSTHAVEQMSFNSNYILIENDDPVITGPSDTALGGPYIEVKTDPSYITLSYAQFTRVRYHIDQTANIVIKILPPGITDLSDPAAIEAFNGQVTAGDQEVLWDGITAANNANRAVSDEGLYTFSIQATNGGGRSVTKRGVLNVYQ